LEKANSTLSGPSYLVKLTESQAKKIVVTKDGPYSIYGNIPVAVQVITPDKEGFSWDWKEGQSFQVKSNNQLCRCGNSRHKPFCDDSHIPSHFEGKETASRTSCQEQAQQFDGPALALSDAQNLCAFARFCEPGGKIWSLVRESNDANAYDLAIREANHCPSGRLVLHDKKRDKEIEPDLPPSVGVVEDPALDCSGPLWVRGGITVQSQDGTTYEKRNRVTLCRCGASSNKPFCDGSHASIKFQDGLLGSAGKGSHSHKPK
jgi:CDGSH-type Zn-finger protein